MLFDAILHLIKEQFPLIDVNVAKWNLNVAISAAAMMLKMMEAVIMMPVTMTMSSKGDE